MKKIVTILILALLFPVFSSAQIMEKVPKQYSLEGGYRYIISSEFDNQAPSGYTFIFDYAWQLSGFGNKKASYITVPIGYTYMPAGSIDDDPVSIVSYGWTVRHELAKDKKVIPWMGYALLLNQYREKNYPGKVFGHQTRFALGANWMGMGRVIPFVKLEYSMTNFPIWGQDNSKQYNFIEVKVGLRI
jgi:hypothetical protein